MAVQLNDTLCRDQQIKFDELSDDELTAFEALMTTLVNPPVLNVPRRDRKFTVYTDACDKQVGCVLLQEKPDSTKTRIGYWSRSLKTNA